MFEGRPEWMQRAAFNILRGKGYKVKNITVSVTVDKARGLIQNDIIANGADASDDVRALILRQVVDTTDDNIKRALQDLGWTPPGSIAALDLPNKPSPRNPLGQGYHRVMVADVQAMEEKIAIIAKTLNL